MTYKNFKNVVAVRSLPWYYRELSTSYEFMTTDGGLTFYCSLFKPSTDIKGVIVDLEALKDFEEKYKDSSINID